VIDNLRPHGLAGWLGWLFLSFVVALLLLGFAVAELGLLVASAPGLLRDFGPPLGFAFFFLGAALALVLAVAVHEAGHLFASRVAGLTARFAHVGPVTFTMWHGRWLLGWDPRQPWLGGRAVCDRRGASRGRVAVFLAGGPAANFLFGVAALGVALLSTRPLVQAWAGQAALLSVFLGTLSLLPIRERWLESDGLALWNVLTRRL
jgi:hypothetical protein